MIVDLEHPKAGPIRVTGLPLKLSETPGEIHSPPPLLGQHTAEVFDEWLKIASSEIDGLREEGVV